MISVNIFLDCELIRKHFEHKG